MTIFPYHKQHKRIIALKTYCISGINRGISVLVKFEIYSDGKFWCARGIGVDIFTQGKTLDELMTNVREAVELHFEEEIAKGENIRILSISECEVGPDARASSC